LDSGRHAQVQNPHQYRDTATREIGVVPTDSRGNFDGFDLLRRR
jgi:hypothetical protein